MSDSTVKSESTVVGLLATCVEEHPDTMFLDLAGIEYRYADVWQRSLDLAGALRACGVRSGQTVVSLQDTHIDAVASWIGTNMLGAVWVGANTALRGEFLRHVVTDAGAAVLVAEPDLVDRLNAIGAHLPHVDLVLQRGSEPPRAGRQLRVEALDDYRCRPVPDPQIGTPNDLTCLTYTGGTTGPSKGCMISNAYAVNIGRRGLLQTQRQCGELNWNPLPMFHLNVLSMTLIGSMLIGGSAALAQRFSASRFWPEIERTGARVVNLIGGLPAIIAQLPDTPESTRCFGQIRMVHAVPFPAGLQDVWRKRFGVKIPGALGYGMTEVFPITFSEPDDQAPPESAGRVNGEDLEVRIVDDEDNEVTVGEVGEIVCRPKRSNVMFGGYWRRPEATVAATRNLWFHTGDLGRFDEAGFFYFVDRKNDYMRRRGENISSQELEATYLTHPDILQVAVHAVPSELTEDDVKVTAVLRVESALTPTELFEWSKEWVPYFALPRYIEFRSELPVSPLGRVHKYQLRDEGCTATTWDRETAGVSWERR
ncbi:AMP-binding protein [Mycobacterium sp. CVI_P3]|uniref:AMP-binding protein n=1 Tax=Mycobacterium pinniadriaticum TaxID=2994102 RepID=A0ABT3SDR4_9MYCO|nr:AMP-binding protein [Mycobacterium pinniadriaticum]MCX2930849.1 AMP-binding protein [Mycobacterium pinniadriaticum]MCX2937273.1 AMP-binding protein [Mycobacterium pinniadriaticum]